MPVNACPIMPVPPGRRVLSGVKAHAPGVMRTHEHARAQELRLERLEAQLALMKQAADHGAGDLAYPALASASAAHAQHHRAQHHRSAGNPGAAAGHAEYRDVGDGGHRGADEGVQGRGAGGEDDEEVGGWISPRHAAAPYRASERRGSEGKRGGADVLTLGSDAEDDDAENGDEDEQEGDEMEADEAMPSFAEPQIRVHIVEKNTRTRPAAVQPEAARGDAKGAARRQAAPEARASAERPAAPDAAPSLSQGEGRLGELGRRHALPCSSVPATCCARRARRALCSCLSQALAAYLAVVPLPVTLCLSIKLRLIIIFHVLFHSCAISALGYHTGHSPFSLPSQSFFAVLACGVPHGTLRTGM